jgi:cytochrome c-type biogenesis protein
MEENQTQTKNKSSIFLFLVVIILGAIFFYGLKWIFSLPKEAIGSVPFLLFDYAVGLTMIFLPCTLPLAFVIVPLSMGKSPAKGIGMALSFGIGVSITLSIYGLLIGTLGQALGVNQIETAKGVLYSLAGLLAFTFALGELGILRFRAPSLNIEVPQFILRQKDFIRALLLGLFLGNVGVGCPNPLFNAVIIPQIVALGSPIQGVIIMFVQALGRITPLLILAFLGILGINATAFLVKNKEKFGALTGWATVFVGSFLLVLGLFGHDWWVLSGQHSAFEIITQEGLITNILGQKVGGIGHTHGLEEIGDKSPLGLPISWGTPFLIFLWILPFLLYWLKNRKACINLGWFFLVFAILIIVVFGWIFPHQFLAHWSLPMPHPEKKIPSDFHALLSTIPDPPRSGQPFELIITLHDRDGKPISDLVVSHERILHLVLVSEDLEIFLHIHPEDFGTFSPEDIKKGEFRIPLVLKDAGRYRVLVDAFRQGKGGVNDLGWINISGPDRQISIIKDLRKMKIFNGYEATLDVDKDGLVYNIKKDGKIVEDLEQYLGADMHIIVFPVDLSFMAHTHGEKIGNSIKAPISFPFPGLWKVYGEFQHKGKVVTTSFMIDIPPELTSKEVLSHTH